MGKHWRYLLLLGLLSTGCTGARNLALDDPLRGGRVGQPAGISGQAQRPTPVDTNDRIPPMNATLAPSTAALTARPRTTIGSDNYLGIEGSAARRNPGDVKQAQWQSEATTTEQARDQLKARGVNWQQSELRDGLWYFRCSIPNRDNPSLSRFYEARAGDEASAIWAVIEKIDGQR